LLYCYPNAISRLAFPPMCDHLGRGRNLSCPTGRTVCLGIL
jgi:hypothetical protein